MTEQKLIEWNHAFDLGLEDLDKDHRKLIDHINTLNHLIRTNADANALTELLDEILVHLRQHFETEENILKQVQSQDDVAAHEDAHEASFSYLEDLSNQYKNDPDSVSGKRLLEFLHKWVINHIFNHDHQMRPDLERAGLIKSEAADIGFLERTLDRFHLTFRIASLAIIPLVVMLFFAGSAVLEKRAMVQEMAKIEKLSEMAGVFSNFVHELQKERGASAGFLGSKGKAFGDKVTAQRKNTDQKYEPIPAALKLGEELGLKAEISEIHKLLNNLSAMRTKIDAQTVSVAQQVGYYSDLNADFLNAIAAMSKISHDLGMSNRISTFVNFLQSKERAGIERAKGAVGFGKGEFSAPLLKDFISLIAIQNTYMNVSRSFATPEILAVMDKTIAGNAITQVDKMREIAIKSPSSGSLDGVSGPQWFDTITQKINLLKKVENYLAADLVKQSNIIEADAQTAFVTLLTVSIAVSTFILVLAFLLIRSVVSPLRLLRISIEKLQQGHTETLIAGRHKSDEIGEMARSIQSFKESIICQNMEQAKIGIDQSLRERVANKHMHITERFKVDVENAIEQMSSAASQLEHHAEAMSKATDISLGQSSTVASAATEATSNVETVAAATEELSSSIHAINNQVSHSAEIANSATSQAKSAQNTIEGLEEGANKIGQVVSLITDIAEQTNMLALNATIEAARAGDAGKGFAVVASEVKTLANQTAEATESIKKQILGIQSGTENAVTTIAEVSQIIEEMNDVTASVSSAVDQQGSATQEISSNINEAATGTRDVSDNIEGVAKANEETGRMSNEVYDSAKSVAETANQLRRQIDTYLTDVSN